MTEAHEKFKAHRPRVGDVILYEGAPDSTVRRVEGNLCWKNYLDGSPPLPFIWCFQDGLNTMHDWPGKEIGKPE